MKIKSQDLTELPQSGIDILEDIKLVLNFGKYQFQVLTSPPSYTGRRGECVFVMATSGTFMVCTTDNSTTWRSVASFVL